MDRQIRRLAIGFLILFGALAVNLNYIQVIAAEDLYNNDANLKRQLIDEYNVDRGAILAADRQTVLAHSVPTRGRFKYLRRYPTPPSLGYAHLTGFYSIVYEKTNLEDTYNDYLAGRADELFPQRLVDEILGRDLQGASLVLTVDPTLQRVASQALGSREGAVAAVDPQTGDVLALVANPTYDPNPLASHEPAEVRQAYRSLRPQDPDSPMVSNATDTFFPPGSSFKIVTAAAALENGMTPSSTLPNPPSLDLPQTEENLDNFGGGQCPGGSQITLAQALQVSCNVAFGALGLQLGAETLIEQAHRFGFSEDIPFDIPFVEGEIPDAGAFEQDLPAVAQSAIGQRDVRTNVLHMALIAGAIGNGGVMMEPRLVREIRDPEGRVFRTLGPEVYGRPMSGGNAAALTQMMVSVVEAGTGTTAQIPGVSVAGKTGTAQTAVGAAPHAWFVSFAPAEDPQIAVAVVVLNGGDLGNEATGGQLSAPIARQVIEAYLRG
ncbi:MAG TPA: penicillin-binding protein 2 [Actinomycetota bacterium]|nr:penicillin-binding protein 2 [Actinomycetota bacterium]